MTTLLLVGNFSDYLQGHSLWSSLGCSTQGHLELNLHPLYYQLKSLSLYLCSKVVKLLIWQRERANVFVCKTCKRHLGFDPKIHTLSCSHSCLDLFPRLLSHIDSNNNNACTVCHVSLDSESCSISSSTIYKHNCTKLSFGYAYKQDPKLTSIKWQMKVKIGFCT